MCPVHTSAVTPEEPVARMAVPVPSSVGSATLPGEARAGSFPPPLGWFESPLYQLFIYIRTPSGIGKSILNQTRAHTSLGRWESTRIKGPTVCQARAKRSVWWLLAREPGCLGCIRWQVTCTLCPWFSHLQNGGDNCIYLMRLWWVDIEVIHVKLPSSA